MSRCTEDSCILVTGEWKSGKKNTYLVRSNETNTLKFSRTYDVTLRYIHSNVNKGHPLSIVIKKIDKDILQYVTCYTKDAGLPGELISSNLDGKIMKL